MGLMTVAFPANAISPTCSPRIKSSRSRISALARSSRLGIVSSASIDLLTSRQTMISAPTCGSSRSVAPHCGRMAARMQATSPIVRKPSASNRRMRLGPLTSRSCMRLDIKVSRAVRWRNSSQTRVATNSATGQIKWPQFGCSKRKSFMALKEMNQVSHRGLPGSSIEQVGKLPYGHGCPAAPRERPHDVERPLDPAVVCMVRVSSKLRNLTSQVDHVACAIARERSPS